jgi:protease-4
MTATSDLVLERRRVRRSLALWRIAAILAILAVIVLALPRTGAGARDDHVARITISGVIASDRERAEAIERIAETGRAKALIVNVNSPGGTVAGSEALYDSLRRVAAEKPVVATMNEVAASGGYLAAIAADHVVARHTSLTGSIGVVAQVPNVSELLDKVGVSVTNVRSAPLKAAPDPVTPTDPAAIEALEATILDSFAWFRGIVAERRGLEGPALEAVTDGRVFTGRQALENGLVDELGAPRAARAWLESEHGIGPGLEVVDYRWGREALPFPLDRLRDALGPLWPETGLVGSPGPRLLAVLGG